MGCCVTFCTALRVEDINGRQWDLPIYLGKHILQYVVGLQREPAQREEGNHYDQHLYHL